MNDDGITHETLAVFIENNRDFLLNVQAWISDRAETHNIGELDHFTYWLAETLRSASGYIRSDIKSLKTGQIH